MLRLPEFSRQSAHEGGKVVSPTHPPPLPSRNIPCTHFSQRLSRLQRHSAAGSITSMKTSNDIIRNRTRDLPGCSAVPQPQRAPLLLKQVTIFGIVSCISVWGLGAVMYKQLKQKARYFFNHLIDCQITTCSYLWNEKERKIHFSSTNKVQTNGENIFFYCGRPVARLICALSLSDISDVLSGSGVQKARVPSGQDKSHICVNDTLPEISISLN